MGLLTQQLEAMLGPGMHIPDSIRLLFDRIESQGTYIDQPSGARIGYLFPEAELKASWTDTERAGGTIIWFAASGSSGLEYWFGHSDPAILNRLCVFARTGAEGSMAAFWIDDEGGQKIVHLGSGSGSVLVCVLADVAIDFIRLLAIGYDEICWKSEFHAPPNQTEFRVWPHKAFQEWVMQTFHVTIPSTASEIVRHPSEMGDERPLDEFARWVNANTQ